MLLPDQIEEIAKNLKAGEVTVLPTNSLWGISCYAFDEQAIQKVTTLKQAKPDNPYILLVSSIEMLHRYASNIHPRVETLMSLHNKPLTLIHEAKNLPFFCVTIDNTVAIRVTHNPLTKAIIEELDGPIISTTAAINGENPPSSFIEIDKAIISGVDFIPPFPPSIQEQVFDSPSVIVTYDNKGEIDFIRT